MDFFQPLNCWGHKNAISTFRILGMAKKEVYNGDIHLDIVYDYSSDAVLETLKRFAAIRGWPTQISLDPGS